jgi:Trypsin
LVAETPELDEVQLRTGVEPVLRAPRPKNDATPSLRKAAARTGPRRAAFYMLVSTMVLSAREHLTGGSRLWKVAMAMLALTFVAGASSASAMTGGTIQRTPPGWAAKLTYNNGHNWCTGELIAPTWVITAGHCVDGARVSGYVVHIAGAAIHASGLYSAPGFAAAYAAHPGKVVYPDVGLVRLSVDAVERYGASTLPLGSASDISYFRSRGVTVFGYGWQVKSGDEPSGLAKSPNGAWEEANYCQKAGDVCFTRASWADSNSITGGDSGGAWVGWLDGGWHLLAVVSGYLDTSIPELQAATSPSSVLGWIDSLVWPLSNPGPASPSPTQSPSAGTPSSPQPAAPTYAETAGGVTHTWTDYQDAGGTEGLAIPSNDTVQITCKTTGFRVADGNTWWYQIASSPWNNAYWASADAFYNNGATSGSLLGTPWVDVSVPDCPGTVDGPTGPAPALAPPPPDTYSETVGGVTHTWTNYQNAGGTEGPPIPSNETVQISCKVTGFRVADGDTWWYQIASPPWNDQYYASADAFYNNGATSGSLIGTPFVDPAVPNC